MWVYCCENTYKSPMDIRIYPNSKNRCSQLGISQTTCFSCLKHIFAILIVPPKCQSTRRRRCNSLLSTHLGYRPSKSLYIVKTSFWPCCCHFKNFCCLKRTVRFAILHMRNPFLIENTLGAVDKRDFWPPAPFVITFTK